MIHRTPDRDPRPDDDGFAGPPRGGPLAVVGGGVVAPLAVAGYGVRCLLGGTATIAAGHVTGVVHGPDAAAVGVAAVSVAVLPHRHYFWGNVAALADLGVHLGVLGR